VRSLLIEMTVGKQALGTGTGFVVKSASDKALLMTNRHNVTGRRQDDETPLSPTGGIPDSVRIVHNRKDKLGEWVLREEPLYAGDQPRWIEHPSLGAKADFVALPLTALDDVELLPYDLANPGPELALNPAQTISVVGFPFGIQVGGSMAVWATGFVASEPDIDFTDLPIFLVDCRTRQGQSGSAVIIYGRGGTYSTKGGGTAMIAGEVIKLLGIYSGRINRESDLGLVWKVEAIQELVDSVG